MDDMQNAPSEHFKGVFGQAAIAGISIDFTAIGIQLIDLSVLDEQVTAEEVWNAIKDLPSDRATGPDGYTGAFYKTVWPVIGNDVVAGINAVPFGDGRE